MSTLEHDTDVTRAGASAPTWGPAWAGALTALPVFLVLQLLFFSFGWLDLGGRASPAGSSIVSAILGIVALLVGGFAVGASSGGGQGQVLQQAALAWAITVLGILTLGVAGAGALLGDVVSVAQNLGGASQAAADPTLVEATRSAAGWAALWLGVSMVAVLVGAVPIHAATTSARTARPADVR